MRIYIDNNLITFLLRRAQKVNNITKFVARETDSLIRVIQRNDIELLISEESLAEIRKTNDPKKLKELESIYFKLKQGKSVIRNSAVLLDDSIATMDSPDVFADHSFTDEDLNSVRNFLIKEHSKLHDFDARYIANAMLPENAIDYFVTADKNSILKYRDKILNEFNVKVIQPSNLLVLLKKSSGSKLGKRNNL